MDKCSKLALRGAGKKAGFQELGFSRLIMNIQVGDYCFRHSEESLLFFRVPFPNQSRLISSLFSGNVLLFRSSGQQGVPCHCTDVNTKKCKIWRGKNGRKAKPFWIPDSAHSRHRLGDREP